ncbi:sugar-binding domain-containing protein [Arthrobacter sp. YD2]|uniref:glycoside hydrolase family 2 protein n=1 Tax=Arthrobacter sp. YD2 TaxID=3058046 RepID=UPI0025B59AD6|nr:sugar-binding domain-containing protein [Arthrobacter sp. YD2]MDN3905958.1 glycoside hydrolase family 2 TIM barrel-domain containing protein [Arthrobacter sp. YD2]
MTLPAFDPPVTATDIPRPEHPRPQFVRKNWVNLNGTWDFEIDRSDSGLDRGLLERPLNASITVPFAPEAELSGIGDTDFMDAVWYRRTITVPADWAGLRPVLHFGAVDYDATVWANGTEVARHRGGFTPFDADLSGIAAPGDDVEITVRARDLHGEVQARGKQATWYANTHCQYTRTTGIWQTVWLEGVPRTAVNRIQVTPNLAGRSFSVTAPLSANLPGGTLTATLTDMNGRTVAEASVGTAYDLAPSLVLTVPAEDVRIWDVGDPQLYGLEISLRTGDTEVDRISSYTALRSVGIDGNSFRLNGRRVFQRLVLDQGYWPESLMTAPSDQALIDDIELSLAAGFNGARLHQKVFEERFLFHADMRGYLVWGEFGDWGVSGQGPMGANQKPDASFVSQWLEAVQRDINHPSIVGWCPLNETHQVLHDRITVLDDVTRAMFLATKLADPSRPVIDASGYSHRVLETDVYDSHSYEQDPEAFSTEQQGLAEGRPFLNRPATLGEIGLPHGQTEYSVPYAGQPFFVSEYGGIWWNEQEAAEAEQERKAVGSDQADSWGYGDRVRSEEEFYARFEGLTNVLLDDPNMFGYCYTQLTDVFQEKNGVYDFKRGQKFDVERLRKIQQRPAAYEERTD